MVLVFSLQPNDINAAPTADSPECQQFKQFLVKDHFQEISDFSELYWLLSAEGVNSGPIGMKDNVVKDINGAFDKKYPGTSVKAKSVMFIGPDTDNGVVNDIVRVHLADENHVDVDVGPRVMGGPGTGEDLFKPLHTLVFPESPVRIQMLKFAHRLVGLDEYRFTETLPNILGKKFDFKNRFQIEVVAIVGTLLHLKNGVCVQRHRTSVKITNLESGKHVWTMEVNEKGRELMVKELSEEQEKLFVEFQEKLKANFKCEWGAKVRDCHQRGPLEKLPADLPMVTTVFNPNGTDGKFTVTTKLRWACEERYLLKLATTSVVSSDEDPDRSLSISQEVYIDTST
eukprot:GHVS01023387.1.p1 GENE.GHVS01023387.1~~GHVS01023387.1.p1  ORF type:complete len:362 (+),score=36.34 GHVS01023387.1:63-1088(+)